MTEQVEGPTVDQTESTYEDYFGFSEEQRWYFPDGKQYIAFQVMTEGDRKLYQKMTKSSAEVDRNSGNAKVELDAGVERNALVLSSVKGWHVVRKQTDGSFAEVGYNDRAFRSWMDGANPKLIDDLAEAIRDANPWLTADQSVEDINREIDRLTEQLKVAEKRDSEKGSSSAR